MYKSKGEKNVSIQLVKDYFIEMKVASKVEIAESTRLSLATITNILKELQDTGFIVRIEDYQSTGGRKAKCYRLCGEYLQFGLLSLKVMNSQIIVSFRISDLDNQMIYLKEYTYLKFTIEVMLDLIKEVKKQYDFEYLGISIPSIVEEGVLSKCDIEELENLNLKDIIENEIGIKITLENDVNTAMLGYIQIHDINKQSVAFIYQPDNHHSGCSLYIHQAIVYGASHFAGELGYLPNGTLQEQVQQLKQDPLPLLVKQAVSVIAIVNPAWMVVYAPCVSAKNFEQMINTYLPVTHQPHFKFIDSMDEYIFNGLLYLCIEKTRYQKRRNEYEC